MSECAQVFMKKVETPQECLVCSEIYRRFVRHHGWSMDMSIDSEDACYLLRDERNGNVGCIGANVKNYRDAHSNFNKCVEILWCYVAPHARRQGVMTRAVEELQEIYPDCAVVFAKPHSESMKRFLESRLVRDK